MVDYFDKGGAIAVNSTQTPATIFSYDNMNYTYSTQSDVNIDTPYGKIGDAKLGLLRSMVCVEAFNQDPQAVENAGGRRREPYVVLGEQPDAKAPIYYLLMFGDQSKYDHEFPINDARRGSECGYIRYTIAGTDPADTAVAEDMSKANVYMFGLMNAAKNLRKVANYIVSSSEAEDPTQFKRYYADAAQSMESYIRYIVSYEKIFKPGSPAQEYSLAPYAQYGWMLAGNYFAVLSNFRGMNERLVETFVIPENKLSRVDVADREDPHKYYERAKQFYQTYLTTQPAAMYSVPGSEYMVEQGQSTLQRNSHSPISKEKVEKLREKVQKNSGGDPLSGATISSIDKYIQYLTGESRESPTLISGLASQNPISRAALYGESLQAGAVTMMVAMTMATLLATISASFAQWISPGANLMRVVTYVLAPLMLALAGFMYTNGAVLGVFIPLIPYMTFLTGVIGWLLQCVESVAAAPLVSIGLIFPETKSEVWGRAAPALMLILNLFLRPSMMIIGLAAAMIVSWIVVEILNIGFLTIIGGSFRVDNMFGFVAILTAYTGAFTFVITEAYSLINVVPNRVLAWIGDQSMGVKGAKEAIGAAKQGVEAGAGAAAGGYAIPEKADMYRAASNIEQMAEANLDIELQAAGAEGDSDQEKEKREEIFKKDPHKRAIYERSQQRRAGGGISDAEKLLGRK